MLRRSHVIVALAGLLLLLVLVPGLAMAEPVKLIIDTDYESDCDDVGALALAHALADRGEVQILATIVCGLNDTSAPAVDVVNTYYGRGAIPVANVHGSGVNVSSRYTGYLAANFPHDVASGSAAPDAVATYREILASQPDASVSIVTIGYATNIYNLLNSGPDQFSSLSGADLVAQKVSTWINMGGNFESRPGIDSSNHNWTYDTTAAVNAITDWPTRLVFNGREIGHSMSGGARLSQTPADNPVRVAYEQYFNGTAKDRHFADLSALFYAVRGTGFSTDKYWQLEQGQITMNSDASFTWAPSTTSNQYRMTDAITDPNAGLLSPSVIQEQIEDLMIAAPAGPDLTAPTMPGSLVAAADTSTGKIKLTWQSAVDNDRGSWVAGYQIYRNGQPLGIALGTQYFDTFTSAASYTYTVAAFNVSGTVGDAASIAITAPTVRIDPHGLLGEYFDNADLTNSKFTRTDPNVNFDWGSGSPDPVIASDTFSVRWSGFIEPVQADGAQQYTFTTLSNDGVRLYVNGVLIIDSWSNGGNQNHSGSIVLEAGQRYSIVLEYYENTVNSSVQLLWQTNGLAQQIVPENALFLSHIPEPASLGLLAGIGLLFLRRR